MALRKNICLLTCVLTVVIFCTSVLTGCQPKDSSKNIPAVSAQTTDGYVYYFKESQRVLIQHDSSTGTEKAIWELKGNPATFNYLVTTSKIFLIDDNKLYSINADGSGKFAYDGSYASSRLPSLPAIVILDNWIYACAAQQGQFEADAKLVRIAMDGSSTDTIDLDSPSSIFFNDEKKLYVIDDYEVSILDTDTLSVSTVELDSPLQPLCAYRSQLYTLDGKCFSFENGQAIEGKRAFDTAEGTPLGGHNGYLFFRQDNGASAGFIVLNLETGESETYDINTEKLYLSQDYCVIYGADSVGNHLIYTFDTVQGVLQ